MKELNEELKDTNGGGIKMKTINLKKKAIPVLLTALILIAALCSGASAGSAGGAAAYLKMGVSARALGMGEAFSAVADDASAAYYNPAGIGMLEKREFHTMHAMLSLDRKLDFANYVLPDPKRKGVWAVSWTRFGVDEIPETRVDGTGLPVLDANGNVRIFSYFSDVENNYSLTFGRKINEKRSYGGSLKLLTHSLFDADAKGFALDLGGRYKTNDKTHVGLVLKNLGASLKWSGSSTVTDTIPVTGVVGVSYQWKPRVLTALDLEKTGSEDFKAKFGVEGKINENIALRAGVNNKKLSVGAGFTSKEWHFDYAFYDEELGANQRISAGRRF